MPDIDDATEALTRMWGDVPEVMKELWHRLPFDQPIILASGRTGHFKKFVEPKIRDESHPNNGGCWCFGVDFVFDGGGSPDHFEFYLFHTGGGGAL
jgi:hypothetical protein